MNICHFERADKASIVADFTEDGLHRVSLAIPFLDRASGKTICVIGQNPSKANSEVADKTLHFIERYIYEKMPDHSKIVMLNLYSRVDTSKEQTTDLERAECIRK